MLLKQASNDRSCACPAPTCASPSHTQGCHFPARALPMPPAFYRMCLPGHYSGRSTYKPFARARGPSSVRPPLPMCMGVYHLMLQQQAPTTTFPRQVSTPNYCYRRRLRGARQPRAIACGRVCPPDTASSDTCTCCFMLACTHLLGSCHQPTQSNAQSARTLH